MVGSRRMLEETGIHLESRTTPPNDCALQVDGTASLYVAIDGQVAGVLEMADPIKASAAEAIKLLHQERIRITMLSGDARSTAEAVAREARH